MSGSILQVVNAGSFWLLVINMGSTIAEQAIEPRCMRDLLEGEGLADPYDLVGREVELTDDGMTISFVSVDGGPQELPTASHLSRR